MLEEIVSPRLRGWIKEKDRNGKMEKDNVQVLFIVRLFFILNSYTNLISLFFHNLTIENYML